MAIAAQKLAFNETNSKFTSQHHKILMNFAEQLAVVAHEKPLVTTITIAAMLSSGHVLLEDVPGIGKTTFVKALSKLLGLPMKRVQFTNDMLPGDIIGTELFDQKNNTFIFHKGPVFTNIVLADELNRASPRTQSALLEAMGEGFVTVAGKQERLPEPFIVFATQNPHEHLGTYPLPESHLDRFSAKLKLNYPSKEREEQVFRLSTLDPLANVRANIISIEDFTELREVLETIHLSDRVVKYVKRFVDASRHNTKIELGVSTRGGVSWIRMARARAMIEGRGYVIPDDLINIAVPCLAHRVVAKNGLKPEQVIHELSESVPIE